MSKKIPSPIQHRRIIPVDPLPEFVPESSDYINYIKERAADTEWAAYTCANPKILPPEWRKYVAEEIRVNVQADHNRKQKMYQLLGKDEIGKAAVILWKYLSADYPIPASVAGLAIILSMVLHIISVPNRPLFTRTKKGWLDLVEALETVRDDGLDFCGPLSRKSIDLAIHHYRLLSDIAPQGKATEYLPRVTMMRLSDLLIKFFGDSIKQPNQLIGCFMRAAFGATWTTTTTRIRSSEWDKQWHKEKELSNENLDLIDFFPDLFR